MPERDPTTGELQVELSAIRGLLEGISKTMLTRDLFDAYRDASNERIKRVEEDQKEWAKVSTAAHVQLEADSKARHQESEARADAIRTELKNDLSKTRLGFEEYKKDIEGVKRTRFNAVLVAGLSLAVAVILKFFVPDVP